MTIQILAAYLLIVYIVFCKLWPYCLYPNYLKKSKIEKYPKIIKLATALKKDDKLETVENIYRYMEQTYSGSADVLKIKHLLTVFGVGDFSTEKILNKKQFLWCHTQNRLLKSLLINTEVLNEEEINIRARYFSSFFIHQWLMLEFEDKRVKIDPFYNEFKILNNYE